MMRVHVIYEYGVDHQPHGSAYIRLLNPLSHPSLAGRVLMSAGQDLEPADVVIVDRTWKYDASLHEVEELVRRVRQSGACLVYSLDDNLLDLDLSGGFRTGFTLETLTFIRLLAREADAVIVSTPLLAERMRRLHREVHVLPNMLDEQLFLPRPPRPRGGAATGGKVVVGYMGTFTHEDDLYMVLEALRPMSGRITLELVGGLSNPRALEAFRPLDVRVLDTRGQHAYPDFVRWMRSNLHWDLGIAPLEDTPFTRCKSDIKFLDYSLLGIPGIYSKVPAYDQTVQHGINGWLASNTPEDWSKALEALVDSLETRQALAVAAEHWVRRNRTLRTGAAAWAETLEGILARHHSRASGATSSSSSPGNRQERGP